MPRMRTLKPGFFTNDVLAEVPALGRLLFAGLWCLADREGRLEDRPRRIKAEVLPYDDADTDALLDTLAARGFIVRYEAGGQRYIQVVNFGKHQTPHMREAPSAIPAPSEHRASTVQAPAQDGASTPSNYNSNSSGEQHTAACARATPAIPHADDTAEADAAEDWRIARAALCAEYPAALVDAAHARAVAQGKRVSNWAAYLRPALRDMAASPEPTNGNGPPRASPPAFESFEDASRRRIVARYAATCEGAQGAET